MWLMVGRDVSYEVANAIDLRAATETTRIIYHFLDEVDLVAEKLLGQEFQTFTLEGLELTVLPGGWFAQRMTNFGQLHYIGPLDEREVRCVSIVAR